MIYGLGWTNWARLVGWLVIGLFIYFLYGIRHSRVQQGQATAIAGSTAQTAT
jgi:APA family basic amino acid/polyamine antiporter